jgi:hypothetical protein
LNSLHPSFAFAATSSSCFLQPDGKTWHCIVSNSPLLGVGKSKALAQADLNNKLASASKKVAASPKLIAPKHHHAHHPHPSATTKTTPKPVVPTKQKHHHVHIPKTAPKPILVRHPLTDPVTTPAPTLTTGTAPAGTGGNAIKQAQNKNQHKVITTTSPSSPIVNDVPTSTDTTQPTDTTSTQQDSTPPSDPGTQTNVLLIGGAIFVGLMVLLLIV